jgi:hypothetical protein
MVLPTTYFGNYLVIKRKEADSKPLFIFFLKLHPEKSFKQTLPLA